MRGAIASRIAKIAAESCAFTTTSFEFPETFNSVGHSFGGETREMTPGHTAQNMRVGPRFCRLNPGLSREKYKNYMNSQNFRRV